MASLCVCAFAELHPAPLPATWRTGGPDCASIPSWQVHEYNDDLYILRQSGCDHYEKPFLYLIFGRDRVLLEDTGAGKPETAKIVMELVAKRAAKKNERAPKLMVVHSHSHGDHTAGDAAFKAMENVEFVAANVEAVKKAFGIAEWPSGTGQVDLGGRVIDVLGIPGHDEASIAMYDRATGILFTGDTLYPGRIYMRDHAALTASVRRMVEFTRDRPVTHILGTHIEQSRTPFTDYPTGTKHQPEEHVLELSRGHLLEFADALPKLEGKTEPLALRDFSIVPTKPRRRQ